MRYLVVGGSVAGLSGVKAVKANDPGAEVTLVTDEEAFYYRPLIPFIVDGSKTDEEIKFTEDAADLSGVEVVYGRAVALDIDKKEVALGSGKKTAFDRLLIATGGVPVIPDVPGISRAVTLRTLDDARRLNRASRGAGSAAVVGGGFVGLKAAAALRKLGLDVTVVERLGHILYPRVDESGAAFLTGRFEEAGIRVLTDETVSEVLSDAIVLGSGKRVPAGVVVAAVGVRANAGWLEGAGVKVDKGVAVDERLMTGAEGVYAAGDVVQAMELASGKEAVSALWSSAVEMGRSAGANMAGGKVPFRGFLGVMNATEFEGVPMVSVGAVTGGEGEVFTESGPDGYRKLVFYGERLVGALFMGDVRKAGIYTSLVRNAIPLGKLKDRAVRNRLSFADFVQAA
jgi:NAD(P)H-nitrite reductase large subunit